MIGLRILPQVGSFNNIFYSANVDKTVATEVGSYALEASLPNITYSYTKGKKCTNKQVHL